MENTTNKLFEITNTITPQQAEHIHNHIKQEKEIVTVSPTDLIQKVESNTAVCVIDTLTQTPIGFIGTIFYDEPIENPLGERGTLWVDNTWRGNKLSSLLLDTLHKKLGDKPLLCLTKVPQVKYLCNHRGYIGVESDDVSGTSLGIILEKLGSIDGYTVFMNTMAYELFILLQTSSNAPTSTGI